MNLCYNFIIQITVKKVIYKDLKKLGENDNELVELSLMVLIMVVKL